VRNLSMLALFAFTCYPLHLETTTLEPPPPVQASADLYNFDQVHPFLWRGGAPSAQGLLKLKELGVKTIIDFRLSQRFVEAEAQGASRMGIRFVSLPTKFFPSPETIKTFFALADEAKADPAKAPLFVHCSHGSDRTGFIIALWRVNRDGWSCAQATIEMLRHGFLVHRMPIVGQPKEAL
jgi:protein tyrosine/serine phosphatase